MLANCPKVTLRRASAATKGKPQCGAMKFTSKEEHRQMGISYSATLAIDQPTRAFLKTNGYTLYLFKGINAGKGATSTVWLTVTGNQLYDQAANTITWSEDYYIGEESTEIQNVATVEGTNPYITSNNIQSVSLGKNYTFPGTAWNPQAINQQSDITFTILNTEQSVNNF
jgi:hypothetical protein